MRSSTDMANCILERRNRALRRRSRLFAAAGTGLAVTAAAAAFCFGLWRYTEGQRNGAVLTPATNSGITEPAPVTQQTEQAQDIPQTTQAPETEGITLTDEEYYLCDPFGEYFYNWYGSFENMVNNHILMTDDFTRAPLAEYSDDLPEELTAHRTRYFSEWTPVKVSEAGTVVFSRRINFTWGTWAVVIDNGEHYTAYLMLSTSDDHPRPAEGDSVAAGDVAGWARDNYSADGEFLGIGLRAFRWDKGGSANDLYVSLYEQRKLYSAEPFILENAELVRIQPLSVYAYSPAETGVIFPRYNDVAISLDADSPAETGTEFIPMSPEELGEYYGMANGRSFGELYEKASLFAEPQYGVTGIYTDSEGAVAADLNTMVYHRGAETMTLIAARHSFEKMPELETAFSSAKRCTMQIEKTVGEFAEISYSAAEYGVEGESHYAFFAEYDGTTILLDCAEMALDDFTNAVDYLMLAWVREPVGETAREAVDLQETAEADKSVSLSDEQKEALGGQLAEKWLDKWEEITAEKAMVLPKASVFSVGMSDGSILTAIVYPCYKTNCAVLYRLSDSGVTEYGDYGCGWQFELLETPEEQYLHIITEYSGSVVGGVNNAEIDDEYFRVSASGLERVLGVGRQEFDGETVGWFGYDSDGNSFGITAEEYEELKAQALLGSKTVFSVNLDENGDKQNDVFCSFEDNPEELKSVILSSIFSVRVG